MNLIQLLLGVALVVFIIVRRFAGQPVQVKSFVLPLGIVVWGGYLLRGQHLGVADIGFLAVEAVLALAVGAARGATIHLYPRDGHLWQRYRWSTLGVWIAAIVLRVGLVLAGHLLGVHGVAQSLALVLGISLVAEAALVGWRAARSGVPLAPGRRRESRLTGGRW